MTRVAPSPPEQGQLVSVRSRHWIVTEVAKSTLPAPALNLIFDDPDKLGTYLDFLALGNQLYRMLSA